VGPEPLGQNDGRIALYLPDQLPRLWRPRPVSPDDLTERERRLLELLRTRGASFFADLHAAAGGGYPGQTVDALWDLAFKALVTNDLVHPLRAFTRPKEARTARRTGAPGAFRSRREAPPSAEGRWSLVEARAAQAGSDTLYLMSVAQQLLARYDVVVRELPSAESVPGGFGALYEVFKALEEDGRIRRGLFASDLGALQFALPPAVDLLRALREDPDEPEVVTLSAADPANAYGTALKWPPVDGAGGTAGGRLARAPGAHVILVNGALVAYAGRGGRQEYAFLPAEEPERTRTARAIASALTRGAGLARRVRARRHRRNGAPGASLGAAPHGRRVLSGPARIPLAAAGVGGGRWQRGGGGRADAALTGLRAIGRSARPSTGFRAF
jgi:ATP-dependent Lhr-like helicase